MYIIRKALIYFIFFVVYLNNHIFFLDNVYYWSGNVYYFILMFNIFKRLKLYIETNTKIDMQKYRL